MYSNHINLPNLRWLNEQHQRFFFFFFRCQVWNQGVQGARGKSCSLLFTSEIRDQLSQTDDFVQIYLIYAQWVSGRHKAYTLNKQPSASTCLVMNILYPCAHHQLNMLCPTEGWTSGIMTHYSHLQRHLSSLFRAHTCTSEWTDTSGGIPAALCVKLLKSCLTH